MWTLYKALVVSEYRSDGFLDNSFVLLLHIWCTDGYADDIQSYNSSVVLCWPVSCDWLCWIVCEEQICINFARSDCDIYSSFASWLSSPLAWRDTWYLIRKEAKILNYLPPWGHWERKQLSLSELRAHSEPLPSIINGWLPSLQLGTPLLHPRFTSFLQAKVIAPWPFMSKQVVLLLATERVLVLVPLPETQAHWDHTVHSDKKQSAEKR